MPAPKYTITKPVQVGIYDSEYVARIYADKIIVVTPTVRWVGNSGGYHEVKESIRDQKTVDAVIIDMADDCEDSAWAAIGRALQDDYLAYADF